MGIILILCSITIIRLLVERRNHIRQINELNLKICKMNIAMASIVHTVQANNVTDEFIKWCDETLNNIRKDM